MKIKYKITSAFGFRNNNEIIDGEILTIDDDSGIALCYHKAKKGECGSFEFIKKTKNGTWKTAFGEKVYVNQGSRENTDSKFRKFLKQLK